MQSLFYEILPAGSCNFVRNVCSHMTSLFALTTVDRLSDILLMSLFFKLMDSLSEEQFKFRILITLFAHFPADFMHQEMRI